MVLIFFLNIKWVLCSWISVRCSILPFLLLLLLFFHLLLRLFCSHAWFSANQLMYLSPSIRILLHIYHNSTTTNYLVTSTVATTRFHFLWCYKSAVRTVIHSCREKGAAGKIIRSVITDTKIGPNFTVAGEKIIEQVFIIIWVKRIVNSCWTGGF